MADFLEGDDDFFGNEDAEDRECDGKAHGDGLRAAELRASEERMYNMGYQEALEEGKTAALQEGFDAGYRDAFEEAFNSSVRESTVAVLRQHPRFKDQDDIDALADRLIQMDRERLSEAALATREEVSGDGSSRSDVGSRGGSCNHNDVK